MLALRRLIEMMEEKSAALAARASGNRQAFSPREIASYWFTHTINASLLPLRHLCFVKHGHPEELFVELSRLAGALCTFGLESHPRSLPLYNHRELDEPFTTLDYIIRTHLEAGTLRVLATTGEKRWLAFPDAPTLKETGIDVELFNWRGVFAPATLSCAAASASPAFLAAASGRAE